MTKGKKNIADFSSALLSNTKIIKNNTGDPSSMDESDLENKNSTSLDLINSDVIKKYEQLAFQENIELSELINLALEHFLNMKDVFFKE